MIGSIIFFSVIFGFFFAMTFRTLAKSTHPSITIKDRLTEATFFTVITLVILFIVALLKNM